MAKTRQSDNTLLLGVRDLEPLNKFNKLPTTKEVLLRFHHHLNDVKSVRNASHQTIDELIVVWPKAAIPSRLFTHAIDKLVKIHSEWLLLKKNKSSPPEAQREHERKKESIVRKVHELFNIAHANYMTMIKLEEDRKFLMDQHCERNMIMSTLDKKLAGMQDRVSEHQREIQARKERASADDNAASSTSKILSAAPLSSPDKSSSNSESDEEFVPNYTSKYPITIHWDIKILPDIVGIEIVYHLPVIVSGYGEENSLEFQSCHLEPEKMQSKQFTKYWSNGILLTSSPEIPLFKRFKKVWHGIVRNNFQILEATPELISFKESAHSSLSNLLNEMVKVPRDVYQELIEIRNPILGKYRKDTLVGTKSCSPCKMHG
ncbi:hypothetical protein AVEN_180919-1 [Araneus ventricosus]|uniref:Uncharacterized protein n=1 Tax=Araneus ventricosus TaxID=182803 RepID=A0A4Y2J104_ARAVE|nr:hypothetical protein AVEN_180919-1 [Araneus ventricosus]